jgi:hypothetical protein
VPNVLGGGEDDLGRTHFHTTVSLTRNSLCAWQCASGNAVSARRARKSVECS